MEKAIVTVDLGYGDSGKGATVDALVREHDSKLVVRYSGGANCGHNVVLPDGRSHCFSQFGSGTLAGADTILDRQVIINVPNLVREAQSLKENFGVSTNVLRIHADCRISTSYHVAMNRAKTFGGNTTGIGIGEVRRLQKNFAAVITFADVRAGRGLIELERIRDIAMDSLQCYENGYQIASSLPSPRKELESLRDLARFRKCNDAFAEIRSEPTTVVFEAAQGVLLDERTGFHPHTTWSTVTARDAMDLIEEVGGEPETIVVGVLRAYSTRHGDGFFPSHTLSINRIDPANPENKWQGKMRFGAFDFPMLTFALNNAGAEVNCIAINHLDEISKVVPCVTSYGLIDDKWQSAGSMFNQQAAAAMIADCRLHDRTCVDMPTTEFITRLNGIREISVMGYGRTYQDRIFVGNRLRGKTQDAVQ